MKSDKIGANKVSKKERAKIKAEIRAEIKKRKLQKTDGLGPYEIKKIREALRQVWHRSHARKLVVLRCTHKDGFSFCEKCTNRTPKLKVDHIKNCGDVDSGYIERLFVPSKYLQGLCGLCHDQKTKLERSQLTYKAVTDDAIAVLKHIKHNHDWGF